MTNLAANLPRYALPAKGYYEKQATQNTEKSQTKQRSKPGTKFSIQHCVE